MTAASRIAMALAVVFATPLAAVKAPRADHPLLGTWKLTVPSNGCIETYTFRADGTTRVSSAAERARSEYQVSERPGPTGYYAFVDRIVKDNGQKDCSGRVTPVNNVVGVYLLFYASQQRMLMCPEQSIRGCLGPFVRTKRRNDETVAKQVP